MKKPEAPVRSILFVCTGNTCRSPMAKAFFNLQARQAELAVSASSAGVSASPGSPATVEAVQAASERGADLASHRARRVTERLVGFADLVLTMERDHAEELTGRWPACAAKTQPLLEYIGVAGDVADPILQGMAAYRACAARLWNAVEQVLQRLQKP